MIKGNRLLPISLKKPVAEKRKNESINDERPNTKY